VSGQPLAKKTGSLIEKETDVRRSICLLFNPGPAIETARFIIKKTVPFWRSFIQGFRCQPSRRPQKKTAGLIEKETLV
jgi:hypothetical protein